MALATVARTPGSTPPDKASRAYFATLFDQHGAITKLNDEYLFLSDGGTLTTVELDMFTWLTLHGEIGLAECQRLRDEMHGGYVALACSRPN